MKKFITLLVLGMTMMSCSKDEDCGVCFETIEEKVLPYSCIGRDGLADICDTIEISSEEVECQEEVEEDLGNNRTRIIKCHNYY